MVRSICSGGSVLHQMRRRTLLAATASGQSTSVVHLAAPGSARVRGCCRAGRGLPPNSTRHRHLGSGRPPSSSPANGPSSSTRRSGRCGGGSDALPRMPQLEDRRVRVAARIRTESSQNSPLEGSGFELPVPRCALIANSAALVAPPASAVRGGSLNGRLATPIGGGPATARLTRREDRSAQLGRGPKTLVIGRQRTIGS